MDKIASAWVAIGAAGVVFSAMVLREVLADWRAARLGASQPARAFLRESLRSTWFRLACLAVFGTAGILPATIPLAERPGWVRVVAVGGLILGEAILTVDTVLAWRAKRRYLAQFAHHAADDATGDAAGDEDLGDGPALPTPRR